MNTTHRTWRGKPHHRSWPATVATVAAALAFALAGVAGARADETREPQVAATQPLPAAPATVDLAELERRFWLCDHAATHTLLDFESAVRCSRATEELRKQRFGDDFAAMLAWWRERKAAEHAAIDAAPAAAAVRPAPRTAPTVAAAQPPTATPRPLDAATPEELKAAYLHCDRLATTERFDSAAAASCSIAYEALKARVFGGSTERVIAWMKQLQQDRDARAADGGTVEPI